MRQRFAQAAQLLIEQPLHIFGVAQPAARFQVKSQLQLLCAGINSALQRFQLLTQDVVVVLQALFGQRRQAACADLFDLHLQGQQTE